MVDDTSKEQTLCKFANTYHNTDYHLVTTEPYFPWMHAAEGCIKQTNLMSLRKMLKIGSPKPLWDHCIDV